MILRLLPLGKDNRDLASDQVGQLTHTEIKPKTVRYLFQPRGLNRETGEPHSKVLVEESRMENKDLVDVEIPMEILGSIVTDNASGFTGMAIAFMQHINGCLHVLIQPSVKIKKTGTTAAPHEFDLRGCSGEKIPVLTPVQLEESKKVTPSPSTGGFPH